MDNHTSKLGKTSRKKMTSAFVLVCAKTGLRSNSELLEVNLTLRAPKIKVLDGGAYPEFRLTNLSSG